MSGVARPPVLFGEELIRERVRELGRRISQDYTDGELAVVGVLKGSMVFMADLIRTIERPLTCHFLKQVPGEGDRIEFAFGIEEDVSGRHVLLVNDVVDTGITQSFMSAHILEAWKPRSLKLATLVDREDHRRVDCPVDYACFKLTRNGFVVGYGLGFREQFRELPYLGLLPASDAK